MKSDNLDEVKARLRDGSIGFPIGGESRLWMDAQALLAHIEALEVELSQARQERLRTYDGLAEKYEHNVKMLQGVLNSYTLEEAKAVAKQALGEGVA